MRYILDACALIAYLHDEQGSDVINELLKKAVDDEVEIYISIVNLLEVHYANVRDLGKDQADVILEKVLSIPIKVVSVISNKTFHEAARLKTTYKMSLGDCIGLATAIEFSGQFVTSDHHELGPVAEQTPQFIFWFR